MGVRVPLVVSVWCGHKCHLEERRVMAAKSKVYRAPRVSSFAFFAFPEEVAQINRGVIKHNYRHLALPQNNPLPKTSCCIFVVAVVVDICDKQG